jgi:hypothetical protein
LATQPTPLQPLPDLDDRIRRLIDEELALTSAGAGGPTVSPAVERRRPLLRVVAALLGTLLVAAPVSVVLATHIFPDVSDGTTHAAAIEHIADAGITAGCNGTANYCPTAAVTRDQMATFLWRSAGRVALAQGTFNTVTVAAAADSGNAFQIGEVTITVPGADNAFSPNQFVKVDVAAEVFDAVTSAKGCECTFSVLLGQPGDDTLRPIAYGTFRQTAAGKFSWGLAGSGVVPATPGSHKSEIWAGVVDRATTTSSASFDVYLDSAIATTVTFGPTGGDNGISLTSVASAATAGRSVALDRSSTAFKAVK